MVIHTMKIRGFRALTQIGRETSSKNMEVSCDMHALDVVVVVVVVAFYPTLGGDSVHSQ